MLIVNVHVHVLSDQIEAFRQATLANAAASVREPGIARFDILQSEEDPARFLLVEVYRSLEATASHKETPHYKTWRDTVAPMMVDPRHAERFRNIFPSDSGW
jgi:quinol monooxygenase YgiN